LLHEGWSIKRKVPAILPVADSSAQFIHQVWSNGIVVGEDNLIIMFESVSAGRSKAEGLTKLVDLWFLVRPSSENILLATDGVVDANIELVGESRIRNV